MTILEQILEQVLENRKGKDMTTLTIDLDDEVYNYYLALTKTKQQFIQNTVTVEELVSAQLSLYVKEKMRNGEE